MSASDHGIALTMLDAESPVRGRATLNSRAPRPLVRNSVADPVFRRITQCFAFLVFSLLAAILVSLFIGSWPAIMAFGIGFIFMPTWDPVKENFGALIPIFGTLVTSLIAMIIAVPVSFGIAMFLTELAPAWLRRPLATAIELLAAIPSIIYGMWGFFVFAPWFMDHLQPVLIETLGTIPVAGALFQGPPMGIGMLIPADVLMPFMLGGFAQFVWSKTSPKQESEYRIPLASGLIAGEALVAVALSIYAGFTQ